MNKILVFILVCVIGVYLVLELHGATNSTTQNAKPEQIASTSTNNFEATFKENLKKFTTTDNNYNEWLTYKNTAHNYSLRYPKNWSIDATQASNLRDFKENCCHGATLIISDGKSKWELRLDTLYTGGGGIDASSFAEECLVGIKEICNFTYEGPIIIANVETYKRVLHNKDGTDILVATIGTKGMPVFTFGKAPEETGTSRFGSIDYTGNNLAQNMGILDKITASLQSTEFK